MSVELLNHMGDDLMVVNAARVSYAKWSGSLTPADTRLIRYLATHNHWTPFSHPQIQFRIKMPLFVAREWYRHTVGLTRNEVSRRYVTTAPEFFLPEVLREAPAPGQSKQGSSGESAVSKELISAMRSQQSAALGLYEDMVQRWGIAPEMARVVLPVSTYTEFIETGSLYAYSRIAKLRIQSDAQKETREYAEQVSAEIARLFPVSWKELMNAG